MRSNSPTSAVLRGPGLFDLGSANGEAELIRRIEKNVGYPPLCEVGEVQRREFHEALLEARTFEDLPGKWQAAILGAEDNRPKLRVVSGDSRAVFAVAGCGGRPRSPPPRPAETR